jgi:hypothetical protein
MSDIGAIGPGASAIRHGEVRYHASLVKLMQATQQNAAQGNPSTVVTEATAAAADNNLGKIVDMKT